MPALMSVSVSVAANVDAASSASSASAASSAAALLSQGQGQAEGVSLFVGVELASPAAKQLLVDRCALWSCCVVPCVVVTD